jgi:hypothetical protein
VSAVTAATGLELGVDEVLQLRNLVRKSDSIELKLTVPESAYRSAAAALDLDPLDSQIRQVFFFDTSNLDVNMAGVIARARRIQGRDGDSVVKLRPVVPSDLPPEVHKSENLTLEVDAMSSGYVCSASMKNVVSAQQVRAATSGEKPLHKLFSREQRDFFDTYVPGDLTIDDLSVLGPIFVLKLKVKPTTFSRKIVVEMWIYPDGSRLAELSTKCLPGEGFDVLTEAREFLAERGIAGGSDQQTKTATALQMFAAELREK